MRRGIVRRGLTAAVVIALSATLAPAAASAAEPVTTSAADTAARGKKPGPERQAQRYADRMLPRMSLEDKIGQLFILFAYGLDADTADARNTALYGQASAAEIISEYEPGGFILFSARDNVADPVQVATLANGLQEAAADAGSGIPLLVSTDQEQGIVTRIGAPATLLPGNMALGAGRSAKDTRKAARITGQELRAMGIQQNNAPDADVNVNPDNPVIGVRSFSSDPELVSRLTAAAVRGYQDDAGIIATAKHFPGHGDTATDSHTGLPVITHSLEEWQRIDAPPFEAAIKAGVDSIMTAHIVVPALDDSGDPATLSKKIVTGQLRDALGYQGVIVTDGLEMAGVRQKYGDGEVAVRAIEAGVDQLLLPADPPVAYAAIEEAVRSGRLSEQRIDESVTRILKMKFTQGVIRRPMVSVERVPHLVGRSSNVRAAQRISDDTTTLVRNENDALPVAVKGRTVLVTGYGETTGRTLAAELTARGANATTLPTGTTPSAELIARASEAAADSDVTVVLTNGVSATSSQRALVSALEATDTHLVVAGVRNPYDINQLPEVDNFIATYSYAAPALASLAKVITGEIEPQGKLPVDIYTSDGSGEVLYPFGHGLGW